MQAQSWPASPRAVFPPTAAALKTALLTGVVGLLGVHGLGDQELQVVADGALSHLGDVGCGSGGGGVGDVVRSGLVSSGYAKADHNACTVRLQVPRTARRSLSTRPNNPSTLTQVEGLDGLVGSALVPQAAGDALLQDGVLRVQGGVHCK